MQYARQQTALGMLGCGSPPRQHIGRGELRLVSRMGTSTGSARLPLEPPSGGQGLPRFRTFAPWPANIPGVSGPLVEITGVGAGSSGPAAAAAGASAAAAGLAVGGESPAGAHSADLQALEAVRDLQRLAVSPGGRSNVSKKNKKKDRKKSKKDSKKKRKKKKDKKRSESSSSSNSSSSSSTPGPGVQGVPRETERAAREGQVGFLQRLDSRGCIEAQAQGRLVGICQQASGGVDCPFFGRSLLPVEQGFIDQDQSTEGCERQRSATSRRWPPWPKCWTPSTEKR